MDMVKNGFLGVLGCLMIVLLTMLNVRIVMAEDLLAVYQLALENDPQLKKAYAKQNAIQELDDQGIARLLPTVTASLSSSKAFLENTRQTFMGVGAQDYWENSFRLNLKQPLLHYDYWVQLNQVNNQIAKAIADYELARQNTTLKVIEAYFKILSAQNNVQFLNSEKQAIALQLQRAKQKVKAGLGTITDIYEAQAIYDRTLSEEIAANNQLADEHQTLIEIIGKRVTTIKVMTNSPELVSPKPLAIADWEKTADSHNLMIIALSNELEVARKSVEIQQSGHLPQLDLIASYSQEDANSRFGLRGETHAVGLQLNIPLYSGGMVSSKVRQANFEYEAVREQLETIRRAVQKQVNNAYRGVSTSISQAESLKTSIKSQETALAATEVGFKAGTRTIVDVLLAERNVHKAKRDYAQSLHDYIINRVKLKYAVSDISQQDLQQINYWLTP